MTSGRPSIPAVAPSWACTGEARRPSSAISTAHALLMPALLMSRGCPESETSPLSGGASGTNSVASMARLLTVVCCCNLLLGYATALAADGGTRGPAPVIGVSQADAGVTAPVDGGTVVDPSRLAEARSLVPP